MKWSLPLCGALALGSYAAAIPSEVGSVVVTVPAEHNATDVSALDSRAASIKYYGVK